jgi:uncharacterized protein
MKPISSEELARFEVQFEEVVKTMTPQDDPSHDLLHIKRVVLMSKKIAFSEKANLEVVVPAAWFHDLVQIPKNDPRRSQASQLSAQKAFEVLRALHYPLCWLPEIQHAIEAHSFSAQIQAKSLAAQIVQDADRLEGLGAVGILRAFTVGGRLSRSFYDESDPWCEKGRVHNDQENSLDHFFVKLFKTAETLHTSLAKQEGLRRVRIMKNFLEDLKFEISDSK